MSGPIGRLLASALLGGVRTLSVEAFDGRTWHTSWPPATGGGGIPAGMRLALVLDAAPDAPLTVDVAVGAAYGRTAAPTNTTDSR